MIAFNGIWVYITPSFQNDDGSFPAYYYALCLLIEAVHSISIYSSYLPIMFFFTQISDPGLGASYMTLLNTISNLGIYENKKYIT